MGVFTDTIPTFIVGRLKAAYLSTLGDLATALTSSWSTWSPTLTNLTLGTGTQVARYRQSGKTVDYYWQWIYGAGSAVGTTPSFTLPVAPAAHYSTGRTGAFPGTVHLLDNGVTERQGGVKISTGSTLVITYWTAAPAQADITNAAPWTWAAADGFTIFGSYEAA